MTKPIEWMIPGPAVRERLHVTSERMCDTGSWQSYAPRLATPPDLVAALAAMGEGERAEVLAAFHTESIVLRCAQERLEAATARAEKAESVLDDWSRLDGHSPGVTADKAREYGRIAAEQKTRAEKAERERDEAREERDCSDELRMGMMPYIRATLGAEARESAGAAARRVVAERDSLRTRVADLEVDVKAHQDRLGDVDRELASKTSAHSGLAVILAKTQREREEAIICARVAARERDEARKELGTLHAERQAIAAALGLLPGERIGEGRLTVAARLACDERDSLRASNARYSKLADEALADRGEALADLESEARDAHDARCELEQLRTRLIAAETAAAQREPSEYPLHHLSRWDGDSVVDVTGTRTRIVNEGKTIYSAVLDIRGTAPTLADVLALASKRGLL